MRSWGIVAVVTVLVGCGNGQPGADGGVPADSTAADVRRWPEDWYICDPVRCGVWCTTDGAVSCGDDPACVGCVPSCWGTELDDGFCDATHFRPTIDPSMVCGNGVQGDQGYCTASYRLDGGRYGGGE